MITKVKHMNPLEWAIHYQVIRLDQITITTERHILIQILGHLAAALVSRILHVKLLFIKISMRLLVIKGSVNKVGYIFQVRQDTVTSIVMELLVGQSIHLSDSHQ